MPTNPNPNYRKNILPGLSVPGGLPPEVEKFLQNVKEHLQVASGSGRGQPHARFVTLQDLKNLGLAKIVELNGRGEPRALEPAAVSSARSASSLSELLDVSVAGATDGDTLRYITGAGKWTRWPFFDAAGVAVPAKLPYASADDDGIVPASGGGEDNFLRADLTWAPIPRSLMYANTSIPTGNTVVSTTSETEFTSQYEIPAGTLTYGSVIRVRLAGVYNTDASVAPNLTLRIYFAAVEVAQVGPVTLATAEAGEGWMLEVTGLVFVPGASGTVDVQGLAILNAANVHIKNTGTFSVDTTVEVPVTATAEWSVSDADNSIKLRQMTVCVDTMQQPVPELDDVDPDEVGET